MQPINLYVTDKLTIFFFLFIITVKKNYFYFCKIKVFCAIKLQRCSASMNMPTSFGQNSFESAGMLPIGIGNKTRNSREIGRIPTDLVFSNKLIVTGVYMGLAFLGRFPRISKFFFLCRSTGVSLAEFRPKLDIFIEA